MSTAATCRRKLRILLGGLLLLSGWLLALGLVVFPPGEPLAVGSAGRSAGDARFKELLAGMAADPTLAGAAVGFCLLDVDGTVMVASPLAATALAPASSLKTLSSAAAIELFTPQFQFETRVVGGRLDNDGVLYGDLMLVGGGDPTLTTEDLEALAAAVQAAGVKRIEGRVGVDRSFFPVNPLSDHWNWGDVGNGYGAGAYGLNLDHNRLVVRFSPADTAGAPAAIAQALAVPAGLNWINEVVTGPVASGDQVVAYSEPYGSRITLRGSVPLGEPGFQVQVANPNPPDTARDVFTAALRHRGIAASGVPADHPAGQLGVLARHFSAPLSEIVPHLHRVSDNLEAQCLFLLLGKHAGMTPSDALTDFWQRRGVAFAGLRILDGSGLARANMIRPLDLAAANHRAAHARFGQLFQQSLTSSDEGRVRSKIGAMSGVRTEVGFVYLGDGRFRTFALMANGLAPRAGLAPHRAALLALAAHAP
jgi:D-alanyl-D-alanine carboxypeptidase/D-alanyl-D-alanine-endopeptidase (penicillin-binding protein 4)